MLGNEQSPPPVYVLVFKTLLFAKVSIERRCNIRRNQSSVAVETGSEPATAASARCNCWGNSFPRFSARRMIPAHARALK